MAAEQTGGFQEQDLWARGHGSEQDGEEKFPNFLRPLLSLFLLDKALPVIFSIQSSLYFTLGKH